MGESELAHDFKKHGAPSSAQTRKDDIKGILG
jgi:hypothetical protein